MFKRFQRLVDTLLFIFFLICCPSIAGVSDAYSPIEVEELIEGYRDVIDRAVGELAGKKVRVRIGISGYRETMENIHSIESFMKEIEKYLKERFDIDLVAFKPKFKAKTGMKESVTPRIELNFFVDERLSLPEAPAQMVKEVRPPAAVPKEEVEERPAVRAEARPEPLAKPDKAYTAKEIESRDHNRAGVGYYGRGEYAMAFSEFINAVIADPDNIQARFNLGVAYQLQGRYGEAIVEFQKVLEKVDLPRAHIMLGAIYVMQGRHGDAVDELKNVVFFDFDSWKISSDGVRAIGEFAKVIARTAGINSLRPLRIDGHTDGVGTVEYNDMLAKKRAIAVAMELVAMKRVEPEFIFISSHSELDPMAPNSEVMGRRLNRRVEIIPVEKGGLY